MTYAKSNHIPDTIKVQSDNGSLRLQFSTQYNPIFGGKRKHQGLGMKDTPENWQKAVGIAWRIEGDLQHPDWQTLFDPTFAKYGLKTKYAAELKLATPIPEPEPEMTVGQMWEDYLVWKQPQLEETTFRGSFCTTYTNAIKGLVWCNKQKKYTQSDCGLWDLGIASPCMPTRIASITLATENKNKMLLALNEAFLRLQSLGKVRQGLVNPFCDLWKIQNKTDKYRSKISTDGEILEWWEIADAESDSLEKDRRAFTKDERDIIIKAFYESEKEHESAIAPLIEFLFLTGCRPGEAFALRRQDIMLERGFIRFSKSFASKYRITKVPKTGEARLFPLTEKLREFFKTNPLPLVENELVFKTKDGVSYRNSTHGYAWYGKESSETKPKQYPGLVVRLVASDAISCYLPPYNARHTFITLQARANKDNTSALLLLAHACGTSVEKIIAHYLEVDTSVVLAES